MTSLNYGVGPGMATFDIPFLKGTAAQTRPEMLTVAETPVVIIDAIISIHGSSRLLMGTSSSYQQDFDLSSPNLHYLSTVELPAVSLVLLA